MIECALAKRASKRFSKDPPSCTTNLVTRISHRSGMGERSPPSGRSPKFRDQRFYKDISEDFRTLFSWEYARRKLSFIRVSNKSCASFLGKSVGT